MMWALLIVAWVALSLILARFAARFIEAGKGK